MTTVPTLLDALRDYLVDGGIVREPNTAGPGARPWLPPVWRHPEAPVAPGDVPDNARPDVAIDDGIVVSLMRAPGVVLPPGAEERRVDGVDIVIRATSIATADLLEAGTRYLLVGPPPANPGGMCDFVMGGLYVIQAVQFRPWQLLDARGGIFTFTVGYTFETRAV
jgi:hypothetical protein